MSLITQTYKPVGNVGQVYARPYGSAAALMPIGNVTALELSHDEQVQKQEDYTRLGGGTYAERRRVQSVGLKMTLSDLNLVNLTRAVYGTGSEVQSGTAMAETVTAAPGGLIRLMHVGPVNVVLKKGSVPIASASYEVRPEGIYILPGAADVDEGDTLEVTYDHGAYAAIEALTSAPPELELSFGGLNEVGAGAPFVVDVWRCSPGITKQLALLNKDFAEIAVDGQVLVDPNRQGVGISRFYRVRMG
jgi:hypothetical protein